MSGATTGLPPCSITETPRGNPKEGAPPIVEFKGVTKTFSPGRANTFTAIRDVTFCVEDVEGHGEFVAILG
ncbi:MAG: hypothetical protein FJY92_06795, partial [Candidatus Hydrogenedentes bacterium]|nr:hypothetical protein [Candidatus Hydrogenedentota bacterium]